MSPIRSPFTRIRPGSAHVSRFYDSSNKEHYLATSRRSVLKTGAVMAGLAVTGGTVKLVSAQGTTNDATPADSNTVTMCVLTPELTEGPYYLDDMLLRDDVTEGKAGLPLELRILVLDSTACTPIDNAAVEIWHCDANGFYSGFVDNSPGGGTAYVDDGSDPNTFLRGLQLTGSDGYVTFKTIYPGWYSGRDVHIHLKVHIGGAANNGTYDGGHVSHTGQLAFSDDITDQLEQDIEPYSSRTTTFTRLEEDNVFSSVEEDDPSFFLTLVQVNAASLADGMTGEITLGIDQSATQTSGNGGQGGPPPRSNQNG